MSSTYPLALVKRMSTSTNKRSQIRVRSKKTLIGTAAVATLPFLTSTQNDAFEINEYLEEQGLNADMQFFRRFFQFFKRNKGKPKRELTEDEKNLLSKSLQKHMGVGLIFESFNVQKKRLKELRNFASDNQFFLTADGKNTVLSAMAMGRLEEAYLLLNKYPSLRISDRSVETTINSNIPLVAVQGLKAVMKKTCSLGELRKAADYTTKILKLIDKSDDHAYDVHTDVAPLTSHRVEIWNPLTAAETVLQTTKPKYVQGVLGWLKKRVTNPVECRSFFRRLLARLSWKP